MKISRTAKTWLLLLVLASSNNAEDFDSDNSVTLSRSKRNARVCAPAKFDAYFLVEVSALVGRSNFNEVQFYLTKMMEKLRISSTATLLSLTSFGTSVRSVGTLNDLQNQKSAIDAVNSLRIEFGARVHAEDAINSMIDNYFTPEHGRREGRQAVCVIIVGSTFDRNVSETGQRLREHCRVVTIGAGRADRQELTQIASEPISRHIIFSRRYRDFKRRVDTTLSVICKAPLVAPRTEVFDVRAYSVGLRWVRQSFARRYYTTLRLLGGRRLIQEYLNLPGRQTQITFGNLTQLTTYVASVWATDKNGKASPRATVIITSGLIVPELHVNESTLTTSSVLIWWYENPEVEASYYVTATSLTNENDKQTFVITNTNITLTNLQSGTRYNVTVSALSAGIRSDESVPAIFVTEPDPPTLVIERVRHISINIRWKDVTGAASYVLIMRDVETNVQTIFEDITRIKFRASNLIPSRKYEFVAYTVGESGRLSTNSSTVSAYTAPTNPDDVTLDVATKTSISVTWSPQTATFGYRVVITSLQDQNYRVDQDVAETRFRGVGMQPGTWYLFTVYSIGSNRVIDTNVIYPFNGQTVTDTPENLVTGNETDTSIEVKWRPVKGTRVYHVFTEVISNNELRGNITQTTNTSINSGRVENLLPGVEYEFKVISEGYLGAESETSLPVRNSTWPRALSSSPRLVDINMTFISIEFDPAQGASSYIVEVVAATNPNLEAESFYYQTEIFSTDSLIEGLFPGNWYNISVNSKSVFGKVNPLPSEVLLEQTVPSPPYSGDFRSVTSTSLTFYWSDVEGAISYVLYVSSSDFDEEFTEPFHLEISTNVTEYDLVDLRPGTLYQCKVQSIGHLGRRSSVGSSKFERTIPDTPLNVRFSQVTTSSVLLEWDAVKGAKTYFVLSSSLHGQEDSTALGPRVLASPLLSGTWYNFTIYSRDSKNRLSDIGSKTLQLQTVPLPPTEIEVVNITSTSIELKWNDVVGAGSYILQAKNDKTEESLESIRVTELSTVVRNLNSGTPYTFQVIAVGEDEDRTSQGSETLKEETDPDVPDAPAISSVTANNLILQWNNVKGARRYIIRIFSPEIAATREITVRTNSIEIENLQSGTQYYFSVFSIGKLNRRNPTGSESSSVYTAPSPPTNISTSDLLTESLVLEWNEVHGAVSYTISISKFTTSGGENSFVRLIPTEFTRLLVDALEPGMEYIFDILAIGEDDRISDAHREFRDATRPETPSTPLVENVTVSSITYTWPPAKGAIRYRVFIEDENGISDEKNTLSATFSLTDLEAGIRYSIRIQSIGSRNHESLGASDIVTQQTITKPPSFIAISSLKVMSLSFQWDSATGASYYELTLVSDAGNADVIPVFGTTVEVKDLEAGTLYNITLKSVGDHDVLSKESVSIEETTLPATPIRVEAAVVREEIVDLSWNDMKGAQSYKVQVQSRVTFTETYTPSSDIIIQGLLAGEWYNFTVFSIGIGERLNNKGSEPILLQAVPRRPEEIEVNSASNDSLVISWKAQRGASAYRFVIQAKDDSSSATTYITENTAFTFENLISGTEYQITGQTLGEQEERESFPARITEATLPNAPDLPAIVSVTSSTITARWNIAAGALSYEAALNGEVDLNPNAIEVNLFTHQNLEPGTFYSYFVYSVGVGGKRSATASPPLQVQTAPAVPNNFIVMQETTGSITLQWDDVAGRSRFEIELSTEINPEEVMQFPFYKDTLYRNITITDDTKVTFDSLISGITYIFKLRTFGMQGQPADGELMLLASTYPPPPTYIRLLDRDTTSISIESQPELFLNFSYEFVVKNDILEDLMALTSFSSRVTINDLVPGEFYMLEAYFIGAMEKKSLEATDLLSVQTVPLPPSGIQIDDIFITSFRVSWENAFGALQYIIKVMSSNGAPLKSSVTNSTSIVITELLPGTAYAVTITTEGHQEQRSDESGIVTETTLPESTGILENVGITPTSILLKWQPVVGATRYQVIYRVRGSSNLPNVIETPSTQLNVTNLNSGTWYEFAVFSIGIKDRRSEESSDMLQVQTVPLPPDLLKVTDVKTTLISLSWEASVGAASYRLEYFKDGNADVTVLERFLTNADVSDLQPGTRYSFIVKAIGEMGRVSESSSLVLDTTIPDVPQSPQVVAVTTNQISLSWEAVQGAINYKLLVTNIATEIEVLNINSNTLFMDVSGLVPGTTYRFVLFSIGASNRLNSEGSEPITQQTVPVAPDILTISNVTTTSMTLRWNIVTGATSYQVMYSSDEEDLISILETSLSSIEVGNLESGTTYRFSVKTRGIATLISASSEEVIDTTVPHTPTPPEITNITTTQVSLAWKEVKGAISYLLLVTNVATEVEVARIHASDLSAKATGLEPGTTYRFVLFSIGTSNRLNNEGSDSTTQQTVPAASESLTISKVTTTTMTLTWNMVTGATSYQVMYSSDEEELIRILETQLTSIVVRDLEPGTTYRFSVRARGSTSLSSASSEEVSDTTVPDTPNPPQVTDITTTRISLAWDGIKGAIRYMLVVTEVATDNEVSRIFSNSFSTNAPGLEPGNTYRFVLFSIGASDRLNSEGSEPITQQTVPVAPDILTISNVTTTSMTLRWNIVTGATSYQVMYSSDEEDLISMLETSLSSIEVGSLEPGTTYRFSVKTRGIATLISASSEEVIDTTVPHTPTPPEITNITTTQVSLAWKEVKGAISYLLLVTNVATEVEVARIHASDLSAKATGLEPGTTYRFVLFSIGTSNRLNNEGSDSTTQQTVPAASESLTISKVTTTTMTLTWNMVTGATSYQVMYSSDEEELIRILETQLTSIVVRDLEPGTTYRFSVRARGSTSLSSASSEEVSDTTVPDTPNPPQVTNITTTRISLAWDEIKGAIRYMLVVTEVATDNEVSRIFSNSFSTNAPGLEPGNTYRFVLFSIGASDRLNSEGSEPITQQTVPVAPDILTISNVTTTSMTLRWNIVTGATSYQVMYSSDEEDLISMLETSLSSIEVGNLEPGTTYRFSVKTRGIATLISASSEEVIDTTVPHTPTPPQITNITITQVSLAWKEVKGAISYLLLVTNVATEVEVARIHASDLSAKATGLEPGTTYRFVLFSIGTSNRLNNEGSDSTTQQTVPAASESLTISKVTTTTMTLTWNMVTGATSYQVMYSSDEEELIRILETQLTSIVVRDLEPGTTYRFSVRARGSTSLSSASSEEVSDTTVPDTPNPPQVTDVTTTRISLAWDGIKGAIRYMLVVTEVATDNEVSRIFSNSFSANAPGLEPGNTYRFVLFSIGASNRLNSEGSEPTTQQTILNIPSELRINSVTSNSVSLSWSAVHGALSYIVMIGSHESDVIITTPSFSVSETSLLLGELISGTEYYFTVKAVSTTDIMSADTPQVLVTTLPATVSNVLITDVTTQTVSITWQSVKGANSYRMSVKNLISNETSDYTSNTNEITIFSLASGTWYELVVFSVGTAGKTNPNGTEPLSIQTVPSAPENVEVTSANTSSLTLAWRPVTGALRYEVSVTSSDVEASLPPTFITTQTSALFNSLSSGTIYLFSVTAIGAEGRKGEPSQAASLTLLPARPTEVIATNVTSTSISIRWQEVKGAHNYRITIRNVATSRSLQMDTNQVSAIITSLLPGTWYEIIIKSLSSDGKINPDGSEPLLKQTEPLAPQGVRVTETNTTSFLVTWQVVIGAIRYVVIISSSDSDATIPPSLTTSELAVRVGGLSSGTEYDVKVLAIGEEGRSSQPSDIINIITDPELPSQPSVVEVTSSSITLTWPPVKGAGTYRIVATNRDTSEAIVQISSSTFVTFTSLISGTWYDVLVFAISLDSVTNSQPSEPLSAQTIPSSPTNVAVVNSSLTTRSLTLSWDPVKGAVSYVITLRKGDTSPENTFTSDSNFFQALRLNPGTIHEFHVLSIGAENRRSERSQAVFATTLPETVSRISITNVSTTTVSLEWLNAEGASDYAIVVKNLDNNKTIEVQTNILTITVEDLDPGRWYQFSVVSIAEPSARNTDQAVFVRTQTVPLPPSTLEATEVDDVLITILWNEVTGSTAYIVSVTSFDGQNRIERTFTTNLTTFTVTQLEPGTEYKFTVRSQGDEGQLSAKSREISETTRPDVATHLEVVDVTTTTITLRWQAVKGALHYHVYHRIRHSPDILDFVEAPTSEATVTGLEPGRWYEFIVFSVGEKERRNEEGSDLLHLQTAPLSPVNLSANNVASTSMLLSWNPVTGAKSYVVRIVNIVDVLSEDIITTTTVNQLEVNRLSSGTIYRFFVTAIGEQNQRSEESRAITEATSPGEPTNLQVQTLTTNTANIIWSPAEGAVAYIVSVKSSDLRQPLSFRTSATRLLIRQLRPGGFYEARISSVGIRAKTNPSAETLTFQTVPLAPTNINVDQTSDKEVLMRWDGSYGADRYELIITQGTLNVQTLITENTEVTIDGLEPGTLYTYFISAINSNDRKSQNETYQQRTVPLAPSRLQTILVRPTFINLTWDVANGASFYQLIVEPTPSSLSRQRSDDNFASVTNLEAGIVYRITVVSVTDGNVQSFGNASITQRTLLSAPTNLEAQSFNATSINLQWDDVTGAEVYTVYYTSVDDNLRKARTEYESRIEQVLLSEITVTGLALRVNYTFEITATSLEGLESDRSRSVTAETYALSPVLPVSEQPIVSVFNVSKTSFVATWESIENAIAYIVIVRSSLSEEEFSARGFRTRPQILVENLLPDTDYEVTIKAVGAIGDQTEESSPPARFKTRPLPPPPPRLLVATKIRAEFIEIEWASVNIALNYEVTIVDESSGSSRDIKNISETIANVTDLQVLNFYLITVRSIGPYEPSAASNQIRIRARHPAPVMPQDPAASLISINSVTFQSISISLKSIEHAVSYMIILRSRSGVKRTIRKATNNTVDVTVSRLAQDTFYDVSYVSVGRGGDRSRESAALRTKTGVVRPGIPTNFQILHVTPEGVTVSWRRGIRAIGYRITVENSRTGQRQLYDDASSPFMITDLQFRETYNISVISVGRYSDSLPAPPITVEIPYPTAARVTGLAFTQVNSTAFHLHWQPTPFAVSYTLTVSEGHDEILIVRGLRINKYFVNNLTPNTTYNATIVAMSHDGGFAYGDWATTTTGFSPVLLTPTNTFESILDTVIEAFITFLKEMPDTVAENNLEISSERLSEDQRLRIKLREHLEQIRISVHDALRNRELEEPERGPKRRKRQVSNEGVVAFENLFSLAREIYSLSLSRDATEATADSITRRLSEVLAIVLTTSTSPIWSVRDTPRKVIIDLLFPIIHHHLNDIMVSAKGPVVIQVLPSFTGNEILSLYVSNRSITPHRFTVQWPGYKNIHRYHISIRRVLHRPNVRNPIIYEGIRSGRSFTMRGLEPDTTYDVTVRPATLQNEIVKRVVGKTRIVTAPVADRNLNANVTSIGTSRVTVSWDKFPVGVTTLEFRIRRRTSVRSRQQLVINRNHKSATFTRLIPGAEYVITAMTLPPNAEIAYTTTVRTLTSLQPTNGGPTRVTSTRRPSSPGGLIPPDGLHMVSSGLGTVTLEWFPVQLRNTDSSFIRYNVRVFRAGNPVLSKFLRFRRDSRITIQGLRQGEYDVTVTTYSRRSRRESHQSPRVRIFVDGL